MSSTPRYSISNPATVATVAALAYAENNILSSAAGLQVTYRYPRDLACGRLVRVSAPDVGLLTVETVLGVRPFCGLCLLPGSHELSLVTVSTFFDFCFIRVCYDAGLNVSRFSSRHNCRANLERYMSSPVSSWASEGVASTASSVAPAGDQPRVHRAAPSLIWSLQGRISKKARNILAGSAKILKLSATLISCPCCTHPLLNI